jgi:hypothetical protein
MGNISNVPRDAGSRIRAACLIGNAFLIVTPGRTG